VCNFFHTHNYFWNNCWRVTEVLSGKSPSFSRTAVEKGIKGVIRKAAFFSFRSTAVSRIACYCWTSLEMTFLFSSIILSLLGSLQVYMWTISFSSISITKLLIIWKILKTPNLISINISKESKLISFSSLFTLLNVVDQLEVSQVTHSDKRLKNKMIDAKFYTITIELMLIMISWQ